jgi:hypothetical protein
MFAQAAAPLRLPLVIMITEAMMIKKSVGTVQRRFGTVSMIDEPSNPDGGRGNDRCGSICLLSILSFFYRLDRYALRLFVAWWVRTAASSMLERDSSAQV